MRQPPHGSLLCVECPSIDTFTGHYVKDILKVRYSGAYSTEKNPV